MGTRAQINIRQGNKVVRVYSQFGGFAHNIVPALRAAASAGYSKPLSIARAIIKQFGGTDIRIIDEDRSDVSYRYAVNVSTKPWRVRQTEMAGYELPTNPDGSLNDSKEALENAKFIPAVTRSFRIGQ
jgi:hypothetical protein